MSNIQKAFKTKAKRGLCMAVGGVLDPVEQNSRAIAAPVIQGNSDLIQNPTPEQPSWGGGFKSMDFDPQANLNSLSPTNPASAPNPAYGGRFGDDPHFSASTSRVIQDRNLGKPRATGSGYIPAQRNAPAPNLMTPVDQLFQERRGLGMADGGVVAETPEQVMARMAAKYGVSAAPATTPNPPVTPAPAPVAQPAQPSGGLFQRAVRTLRGRAAQIDMATGYAQGGVAVVKGPGTGTSDDIPISLNAGGERMNINVSNGEGLAVLPAKTMQHPEAIDAVNTIIETTNGKPPRGLKAGASYAVGTAGLIDDEVRARAAQARVTTPTPAPAPTATATAAGPNMAPELEIPAEKPAPNAVRRMADKVAEKVGYSRAAPATATPAAPTARVAEAPLSRVGSIRQAISGKNATTVGDVIRKTKDVVTSPRAAQTGAGMLRAGSVAAGLEGAYRGLNTDTDDYYARTGIDREATVVPQIVKDLGVRGLGVLSDVGASAINGVMLPANLLTHGLDTDKWYDYRDNFADVAAKKENALVPTPVKPAPEAVEPGAQERTFSAGKPGAAAPAPTTAAEADTRPNAPPANDIQRRSIRTPDGRTQTEFYGKDVKQTYTGADGKPTTDWKDTKDYKEAIERNKSERRFLNDITGWNIDREVASSNPAWRERGLARQKVFNEKLQRENERSQLEADRAYKQGDLEMRREDLGLRRAQEERALASAQRQMQRDAVEMDLKTREAMDKDEEQVRKIYAGHFLTKNDKGEMIEDKAALDDFLRRANHSILAEGRATKDARLWDANTNRPKSFANMDKATQDFILNRYNAYRRWKQAQGVLPGYADKGDTMNLFDLNAQEDGDYLVFPRLGKARAQKKDFMYTSPVGALDLAATKTPEDTLYRNLLGK